MPSRVCVRIGGVAVYRIEAEVTGVTGAISAKRAAELLPIMSHIRLDGVSTPRVLWEQPGSRAT